MKQRKSSQIAKTTAFASFIIGTVIFLLYLLTNIDALVGIGLAYVSIAIFTNSILLFFLIIDLFFVDIKERVEIIKYSFLMLLNIPIAFLYLSLITI